MENAPDNAIEADADGGGDGQASLVVGGGIAIGEAKCCIASTC